LIAVPTGGRQEDLAVLLTTLSREYGARHDVHLLLVDNNPEGGADRVFEECCGAFGARKMYVHEPKRGYSAARNAVLRGASGFAAIAMIDDDEVPSPGWLDGLIEAQRSHDAQVVAGRVVNRFPPGVPTFYRESGVFTMDAPDLPDGAELRWCATNNTLVTAAALEAVPEGFDPRFDRMSGEDVHFFLLAHLRGCRIVWTNRAVVTEELQPHRFNRRWLMNRAIRSGNSHALIEVELIGGMRTIAIRAGKAAALMAWGLVTLVIAGVARRRSLRLRGVYRLGRGYGMALGLLRPTPWEPPS
jgi:GT2 family glycosyltransferase